MVEPLQVNGEPMSDTDLRAIASVSADDVQAAVDVWQQRVKGRYKYLLSAKKVKD